MTRRYLIGNWKLYVSARRSGSAAREIARRVKRTRSTIAILCPVAPALADVRDALRGSALLLGAQNVSVAQEGAATGSIAARDLKELGCRYVIVGHSERRAQGETDRLVARKLRAVHAAGLVPVLCVGEPVGVRRAGKQVAFVGAQLRRALTGFRGSVLVAYEPVWAISKEGHGAAPCPPALARQMRIVIDRLLRSLRIRPLGVLYGGSVTPGTIAAYVHTGGYDGALVGFASTKPGAYARMVKALEG